MLSKLMGKDGINPHLSNFNMYGHPLGREECRGDGNLLKMQILIQYGCDGD